MYDYISPYYVPSKLLQLIEKSPFLCLLGKNFSTKCSKRDILTTGILRFSLNSPLSGKWFHTMVSSWIAHINTSGPWGMNKFRILVERGGCLRVSFSHYKCPFLFKWVRALSLTQEISCSNLMETQYVVI